MAAPVASLASGRRGAGNALAVQALARVAHGDIVGALLAWRRALEGGVDADLSSRVSAVMARVGGRGRRGTPPPPPRVEPASAAWARAWAGDLDGARDLVAARPEDAANLGLLGAVAVLERRPHEALPFLDRAIVLGGGEDIVLFRARALLQLQRVDEASRALKGLVDGESFARRVLVELVSLRSGHKGPGAPRWLREIGRRETYLNGFFVTELPAVAARAELEAAFVSVPALTDLLERLLDRMAGNLGPSPTVAEVGPDGERRFSHLEIPPSMRARAVVALDSVRYGGPASAEASLSELRRRFPRSVHPRCYRGELYLWLGRYGEAWRDFIAARWIGRARWADIGLLAVLVMTGRLRRARVAALLAEHGHDFIPGGTLPVYRGMLRRRSGDLDSAIAELGAAVEAKPTRVGARIELVLALRAAGLRAEGTEHAAIVVREAAPALFDAADRRGLAAHHDPAVLASDEVLEEALRAMRGNRSSSIVTWFTRGGEMRVLEARPALAREAAQAMSTLTL